MDKRQPKILVVEDEPAVMEILLAYLGNAGYIADSASDGQMAWEKLSRNSTNYSAIIVDRNMPHLDGMQLNQLVKKDARFAHIPVIMQTGATSPKDVTQGIKAGVYYYLTKPYEEEALLSVVQSALREKQHQSSLNQHKKINDNAIPHMMGCSFRFQTLAEAEHIAAFLGHLFPDDKETTLGLYELFVNAIEHGNLGIGFDIKAQLLSLGKYDSELKSRMMRAENQRKFVQVDVVKLPDRIDVTVSDQGLGFDWKPYLEMDPERTLRGNGRGIAKSNMQYFDQLQYQGRGNRVTATTLLQKAEQEKNGLKSAYGTHG